LSNGIKVVARLDLAPVQAMLARARTELLDRQATGLDLLASVDPVVAAAKEHAWRRTGEGAASIHAELDDPVENEIARVVIGPTKKHWYMRFQEIGTRFKAAVPFLRPALDEHLGAVVTRFVERVAKRFQQVFGG
jgi:HK97 gp10 family phage protein